MEFLKRTLSGLAQQGATTDKQEGEGEREGEPEKATEEGSEVEEDECLGCSDPCEVHPSYPPGLAKKINQTKKLQGTVKAYSRHVIVCAGEASKWPPKVDKEDGSLVQLLSTEVSSHSIPHRVLLTAAQIPSHSSSEDKVDILIFPDSIKYIGVDKSQFGLLVEEQLVQGKICESLQHELLSAKKYLMICAHKKRDKRCGTTGPILAEQFWEVLQEKNMENEVVIGLVSHFGGHKFAGNVIVYPEGVWYGRVTPCDVPMIVDKHLIRGEKVKRLLRGQMDQLKW